jgi:hypothetical protein
MAKSPTPTFDKAKAAKMADGPAPTITTWYRFLMFSLCLFSPRFSYCPFQPPLFKNLKLSDMILN